MLENLKEVILNLEKSLNMMVQNEDIELLRHPEYLQAMKEVVQSINQVTRTLKNLEGSYSEGREQDEKQQAEKKKILRSAEHSLKVINGKLKDRRASSK